MSLSLHKYKAARYDAANILPKTVGLRLLERLDIIPIEPRVILDLGAGSGYFTHVLALRYPKAQIITLDVAWEMLRYGQNQRPMRPNQLLCANATQLPLLNNSIDLVFSNLMLPWCDLDATLTEIKRILTPKGLLLFSTLGPDTLQELRVSWEQIDTNTHIQTFIDMHHVGDHLVQAKFTDPVISMEKIVLNYRRGNSLIRDLKAQGGHPLIQIAQKTLLNKAYRRKLIAAYEQYRATNSLLPATFEIIYGHALGPTFSTNEMGEVFIPLSQIQKSAKYAIK